MTVPVSFACRKTCCFSLANSIKQKKKKSFTDIFLYLSVGKSQGQRRYVFKSSIPHSMHPGLKNAISIECLEGISSDLAHMFILTQE